MSIHIDSFSGAVADLSKKEQGDPTKVLMVLTKSPLVSAWDMGDSANLRGSLTFLRDNGMIKLLDEPYPWYKFELTSKGKKEVDDAG